MELINVLDGIEGLKAKGDLDTKITGVISDSRNIKKGNLFVAINGYETDGHQYIEQALENGAIGIMVEEGFDIKSLKINKDIILIVAKNTRYAFNMCVCNYYKHPSRNFKLIGITGTKGKTTTAFMIKAILEKSGKKVGTIGTLGATIGDEMIDETNNTTPEGSALQEIFLKMKKEKVEIVVMEVSSQSLKLDRLAGIEFDMGIFTNLSEEHISENEHPDIEDYFNSKLKLFNMCKIGYINADDVFASKIKKLATAEIHTYGIDNFSELIAKDVTVKQDNVDFKVKITERNEIVKVGIPGRYSVYNALGAICVAKKMGASADNIKEALMDIKVPGRAEIVPNEKGINIIIDYAHTPESLKSIITSVKYYAKGRIITLFGSAGERDARKRPMMGEISAKLSDFTIITTENPKRNDPKEIIKDIENGAKKTNGKYICIVDREEAIRYAIKMANKNDTILLAGKGHELYEDVNGKKVYFDERAIIHDEIEKSIKK